MTNNREHDDSFLQHALMEETRAYVERGRVLKDLNDQDIMNICVAAVERWFGDRSDKNQREMDDVAAEIRLRGLEMPEERLKPLTEKMREEMLREPRGLNEKTRKQIREFIEERDKPQS
jgi:hypothetical protein